MMHGDKTAAQDQKNQTEQWGQRFHDRPMREGGIALTIEPGICDLTETLSGRR